MSRQITIEQMHHEDEHMYPNQHANMMLDKMEKLVLADWIADKNFAVIKRMFKSNTFLKNLLITMISGIVGHLIGGLVVAIMMIFVVTLCEEWFDSFMQRSNVQQLGIVANRKKQIEQELPIYEKEASVLFADIRNFTGLTAELEAIDSFRLIKDYMNTMLPVIDKNRGIVNQVMGDGILAVFHDSPDNAIEAAIDMQNALLDFNAKQNIDLKVGVGIATGPVLAGKLKGLKGENLFITSHTVNVANRIEQLTKRLVSNVLVCEKSINKSSYMFRHNANSLGTYQLKGNTGYTEIYSMHQTNENKIAKKGLQVA